MGHRDYSPLGRRWRRRGFRLHLRLRRLAGLVGLLGRCLGSLGKRVAGVRSGGGGGRGGRGGGGAGGGGRSCRCRESVSRRGLVCQPLGRSNSFYADAIADCLEFIKRTSVSRDGGDVAAADG